MTSSVAPAASNEPIRMGRYVLEDEIARGAMGVVYRAVDPSVGRKVALKRLLSDEPRLVHMFEREFHALRSLQHPRIIEVFEYGVTPNGAYYSMELLDGADLRELAPLPFPKACKYLRDVASSLGLLHARRMLHRDISPRNVRVTSDDRAKLIDFGGMTPFGIPEVVMGTPPCVPPEALHHAALDQRSDLYALGALAYYLLTGRYAYPAREFSQLREVWEHAPARPSDVVTALKLDLPPIPAALDDLVMSSLTLNALGRPASAAEVIDRLEQIAGLEPEHDEAASRSYLFGAATVGRERERERLEKRLSSAIAGEGACIVVEGESGMGISRLLTELTINAQLAGALPLLVDAGVERGAYGVALALASKALEGAPLDAVAAAAGHEPTLARFSPLFASALATDPDTTNFRDLPGELRKRIQSALSDWLLALTTRRPIVIVVDNAHHMDEASSALLTTLAGVAPQHPLMLVIAAESQEAKRASASYRVLHAAGSTMVLRGLGQEHVHTLVKQLFGDVPNSDRLAAFMHRVSGGNPQACMNLAAHLVNVHSIRYIQGTWVLPHELSTLEVPKSVEAVAALRLTRLSEPAQHMAEMLAVHRSGLSLERCLTLAKYLDVDSVHDAFSALSELTTEGVLIFSGGNYYVAREALGKQIADSIPEDRRKDLHRALGALLANERDANDVNSLLDAGWHLLHGGDELEGARLLADAGLRLTYDSDDMSAAIPALRSALEVYRRVHRPMHEQLSLLVPLSMAGYYSDRRLADEFGDETLRLLRRHLGLHVAAILAPLLGRHLSTWIAIGVSALRHLLSPALGGLRGLQQSIVNYISCCTALTGVAVMCLDLETAKRRATHVKQLDVLGRDSAAHWASLFVTMMAHIPEERFTEIMAIGTKILARLDEPRRIPMLPRRARRVLEGGVIFSLASMDAFRTAPKTLEYAERLDQLGLKLYEMVADQLRTLYYALRGEVDQANHYRTKLEAHAVQAGSAWQAEIWVPSSMIVVTVTSRDTIGLKRTMEQLDRLAGHIPSLKLHANMVRAEYYYLKGDYDRGLAIAGPIIESTKDREFVGRSFSLASQARALNRLGRYQEAKDLMEPLVDGLSDADQEFIGHYSELSRELAHAYSGLGEHARARTIIEDMLDRHKASDNPLQIGNLHATMTVIALASDDILLAREHLQLMEKAFRPTGNPSLISQCEHMRRETRRAMEVLAPASAAEITGLESAAEGRSSSPTSLLSADLGPEQRAEHALELLIAHVKGRGGYLFSFDSANLELLAPRHGAEPHTEILDRVRDSIAGQHPATDITVITARIERTSLPPPTNPPPRRSDYRTYLLTVPQSNGERMVGVVAIEAGSKPLRPPEPEFLRAIARALFESGDAGKTVITSRQ